MYFDQMVGDQGQLGDVVDEEDFLVEHAFAAKVRREIQISSDGQIERMSGHP